jgi:hypothetical protein
MMEEARPGWAEPSAERGEGEIGERGPETSGDCGQTEEERRRAAALGRSATEDGGAVRRGGAPSERERRERERERV